MVKHRSWSEISKEDYEVPCDDCGALVFSKIDGKFTNHTVKDVCDWGNCTVLNCANCGAYVNRGGFSPAGYPDCPCYGHKVPKLRWPWTSERIVDAYCSYHMWAFGLRLSDAWWRHLLKPVPYVLFGNYTGAQYRHARLYNPEYFERKRGADQ
jgi:hypothetical protein